MSCLCNEYRKAIFFNCLMSRRSTGTTNKYFVFIHPVNCRNSMGILFLKFNNEKK